MMILTSDQRNTLYEIWTKDPISPPPANKNTVTGQTYREFRATVQPEIGTSGCIRVISDGMLIGIERDGYPHT